MTTAPVLGEPLPIELANTTYAVRGHPQDGLADVDALVWWLDQVRPRLRGDVDLTTVDTVDLRAARELRDCIRALASAAVTSGRPSTADVDTLNRHVRVKRRWRELRWDREPTAEPRGTGPSVAAILSAIAQEAVDLFTGPAVAELRACQGPGCVLFFIKGHHRRGWCSAGCGNRARAARHYDSVRNR